MCLSFQAFLSVATLLPVSGLFVPHWNRFKALGLSMLCSTDIH